MHLFEGSGESRVHETREGTAVSPHKAEPAPQDALISQAGRSGPAQGALLLWLCRAPGGHFPDLCQEEAKCLNSFLRYRYLQHCLMKNTVTKTWWFLPLPNLKMRAEKTFCPMPKPKSAGKNWSGPKDSQSHTCLQTFSKPLLALMLGLHTVLPLDSWLPEK